MKHSFELINGRINLVLELKIWGETITEYRDVHDELIPVFDEVTDIRFRGMDYKIVDNVLTYIGKDKDKYNK